VTQPIDRRGCKGEDEKFCNNFGISCSMTLQSLLSNSAKDFGSLTVFCRSSSCSNDDPIYGGSQFYSDHSSICRAAEHQGILGSSSNTNENGGLVVIDWHIGSSSYPSVALNGIISSEWNGLSSRSGSFQFVHLNFSSLSSTSPTSTASSMYFNTWVQRCNSECGMETVCIDIRSESISESCIGEKPELSATKTEQQCQACTPTDPTVSTSSSSSSSSKVSSALIGGLVGGICSLVIILVGLGLFLRYRKNKNRYLTNQVATLVGGFPISAVNVKTGSISKNNNNVDENGNLTIGGDLSADHVDDDDSRSNRQHINNNVFFNMHRVPVVSE